MLLIPLIASSLDFSFYGRPPDSVAGGTVQITAGVVPGVPVLFETSGLHLTILRPASEDEVKNRKQPIYRFEWQQDKSARFYELADPVVIERLTRQNATDTASPEGKKYELSAVQKFFDGARVLQKCVPPKFLGTITAFFMVSDGGKRERVIVLPEGGIAECITESASATDFPKPPYQFTVKAEIVVKK